MSYNLIYHKRVKMLHVFRKNLGKYLIEFGLYT